MGPLRFQNIFYLQILENEDGLELDTRLGHGSYRHTSDLHEGNQLRCQKGSITVLIQSWQESGWRYEGDHEVVFDGLWLCRIIPAVCIKIDGALDAVSHFPCFSFALHFLHHVGVWAQRFMQAR